MRKRGPRAGNPGAFGGRRRSWTRRGLLSVGIPLLGGILMAAAPSTGAAQSVPGPHPSWALVRADGGRDASAALELIRESLTTALAATGIAPEGFPRPCTIIREPDPSRPPGWFQVSCVDPGTGAEADGILLDSENHYMALEVVDYPSARAFLLEVYLVPRLPYPPLATDQRYEVPRVVVFHPLISAEWHPAIWEAIETGVAATGAQRLSNRAVSRTVPVQQRKEPR